MIKQALDQSLIWVIDDDQSIRWVLEKALSNAGAEVKCFESASKALTEIKRQPEKAPATIISDVRMPGIDGFEFLKQLKKVDPLLPVIIMTAYSDLDTTVQAYQDGAFEYLPKPFDIDEVIELTQRACAKNSGQISGKFSAGRKLNNDEITEEIVGDSPAMQEVFRIIGRLSRSHISVLIDGESGTGKELIARALHKHSPRLTQPFIAINTAAIPADLLESELFGHEKGAFSGALEQHIGRFEQADKGTLFLDEIGDMPMELQTRLLRVLAEGEFFRVGGSCSISSDVRIIAATHRELKTLVESGKFREDLYHRLNVVRIQIPPLRQRREDIPLLLSHFLKQSAVEVNDEPKLLNQDVIDHLSSLDWPGNVRQIENTCRWFSVMASGKEIHMNDLPDELVENQETDNLTSPQFISQQDWHKSLEIWANNQLQQKNQNLLKIATPIFEKTLLECALAATGGRKKDAAKLLGWGRNTLTRKLKELYE